MGGECGNNAAWLDCVEEDEEYLNDNDFYGDCTPFVDSGSGKCFEDRCRPVDKNNPLISGKPGTVFYPGYDTKVRKTKPKKKLANKTPYHSTTKHIGYRPARSIYEKKPLFTLQASNCRVLQSKNSDLRRRCDRIIETRNLDYEKAISLFPQGADLTKDEDDFDLSEF